VIQAQYIESQQLLSGNSKQKEQELAKLETAKNKETATLENSLSTITTEQEKLTKQLSDVQNQLATIKKEKEDVQTQFA
ncbi:hypothetical protein DVA78_20575, partial [Acinetobacter baumannii]